jgi:hypothetical protein
MENLGHTMMAAPYSVRQTECLREQRTRQVTRTPDAR